jgi:hypothetical protein
MIGQLNFIAIDHPARQTADGGVGAVAGECALGEDAECQSVMVLLGQRNQRGIAEHSFIVRHF